MRNDPIRLVDDGQLASQLRDDLRACAGSSGGYDSDAGLARLSASIAAGALAGVATAHAGAASTVKVSGLSLFAKIATCVAVASAVGGGVAFVASESSETAPPGTIASHAVPSQVVATSVVATSGDAAPTSSEVAPSATVSGQAAALIPSSSSAPPTSAMVAMVEPSSRSKRADASTSSKSSTTADPTQVEPSRVKEEIAFMAELRERAGAEPAAAAALADEGQARFPGGLFWQDREAIAVQALVRGGRQEEARRRARAFLAQHPESPFAERIRRVTGLDSAAAAP